MADTFQNEVPRARINLKLSLHTGGAQKKVELPLKLLTIGDFSHGKENRPLSEREKINVNKNNFNSVLSEFSPEVNLSVPNTLAGNGEEENVRLRFTDIKDFEPEQVARQIPQLRAMLAMRNLLRDLKSNLLDNATFRKELEAILKDPVALARAYGQASSPVIVCSPGKALAATREFQPIRQYPVRTATAPSAAPASLYHPHTADTASAAHRHRLAKTLA
ncbi:type VI secretion system contractile sheath small subunit [Klebsiella pneumoniae]|nr:type VI secretion system contractile sheath small subunit [Klebsiella pneumoniae]WJY46160.1 type VI secretion system contractile sheath small subunit [Klebsiella pneumoniae]WKU52467.1 type VI secretion system contractile sheath small subunit [Klebsiella pneumoniae]